MADLAPDNIQRLVPYRPGKPVEELERELGIQGAVKLASNESPFGPSPKALAAIAEVAPTIHRYPDAGAFRLRRALSSHHDLPMDTIAVGHGSNELIDLLVRALVARDEHVVFGHPSFVCYQLACTSADVAFTAVPLREHLAWDVDALLSAVTPKTKLLFVANPNNPTGAYIGSEELERLLTALPPDVVAVIDEAYFELADAPDYRSALAMRGKRERLVVLRTFSKAYGLAALRVGYALAPAAVIDLLNRVRAPFNVGTLGQAAAIAALSDQEHVRAYLELNRKERQRVAEGLVALGRRVAPSQTNFVLAQMPMAGKDVYNRLLRKGVIVRPMPAPIEDWLRISIGLPEENTRLLQAMDALFKAGE